MFTTFIDQLYFDQGTARPAFVFDFDCWAMTKFSWNLLSAAVSNFASIFNQVFQGANLCFKLCFEGLHFFT